MVLVAPFASFGQLHRFVSVGADGTVNGNGANNSLGFAPGFDL